MGVNKTNLFFYPGVAYKEHFVLTDNSNTPIDLTGATSIILNFRSILASNVILLSISLATGEITITDAPNGEVDITMTKQQTGGLVSSSYDCEVVDSFGVYYSRTIWGWAERVYTAVRDDSVTIIPPFNGTPIDYTLELDDLRDVIKDGTITPNEDDTIRVLADLNQDGNYIEVDYTPPSATGGGEDNTASNIGGGIGVFAQKIDVDLQFKSNISSSTELNITASATEIDFVLSTNAISNDKLTQISQGEIKGRSSIGVGNVEDLTDAQVRTIINVEDGATANDTDANLRDRTTHTGTQTASTISDFQTEVSSNTDVVANTAKETNATHTGEVTGDTGLTLSSLAISNKPIAPMVSSDLVLFLDQTDGLLKQGDVDDFLSSGEINTASNLGGGEGVFAQKIGFDLQFKSLISASNELDITPSATEIDFAIALNKITNDKLEQINQGEIKGRSSIGFGNVENLTDTEVRTIINVEDGATANDTDANLRDRTTHTGDEILNDQLLRFQLSGTPTGFGLAVSDGIVFVASQDLTYDPSHGAILLGAGRTELYGTSVMLPREANGEFQQAYIDPAGRLYGGALQKDAWSLTTNDTTPLYDLGTGTGAGTWVEITGLTGLLPENITIGDTVDISYSLHVENKTPNRTGTIEVGFTTDSGAPTEPTVVSKNNAISAGYIGYISGTFRSSSITAVSGDNIRIWARINAGSHNSFGIDVTAYTVPDLIDHEFNVREVAGGGGGAGLIEAFSGLIEPVSDGDYVLESSAYYEYYLEEIHLICESGSCTVTMQINSSNITGLVNLPVSSTGQSTIAPSTDNLVSSGQELKMVITGNSSTVKLSFNIKTKRQ